MRISDWSSDVCSSDLLRGGSPGEVLVFGQGDRSLGPPSAEREFDTGPHEVTQGVPGLVIMPIDHILDGAQAHFHPGQAKLTDNVLRSEENTSELQSLMRISYAVFCLKKKTDNAIAHQTQRDHVTAHVILLT